MSSKRTPFPAGETLVELVIFIIYTFVNAFSLYVLWGWFVEPFGIIPLRYMHSVGLILLLGIFSSPATQRVEFESFEGMVFMAIFTIAAKTIGVLGLGWIAYQFIMGAQ